MNTNNGRCTDYVGQCPNKNGDELEFAIFCIENIVKKLGKNAEDVYRLLTEKSDILNSYIIPEYEMPHTQSKEYIIDDMISLMEKGVSSYDCISRFLPGNPNSGFHTFQSQCRFWSWLLYNPTFNQAVKWCEKFKCRGKSGIVSRYDFDEKAYHELKVLEFDSDSKEWLDFIPQCRTGNDAQSMILQSAVWPTVRYFIPLSFTLIT